MKNYLIVITVIFSGFGLVAQNHKLRSDLKSEFAIIAERIAYEPLKAFCVATNSPTLLSPGTKIGVDAVNIITLGSSANAFSYGYSGGQKSLVSACNELNTVSNIHRMGGTLDPGGFSGDLGYDISTDGGMSWTNMVECYVANNVGGEFFPARYPNHGILNPIGNTNVNDAYVAFFAPNLDGSNHPEGFGGYSYGRSKIGDPSDTTKNLRSSRPLDGVMQYFPDAYCVTNTYEAWVGDLNQDWSSGTLVYLEQMIVNHGVWDDTEMDLVYEEFLIDCPTIDGSRPLNQKVEFSLDGMTGYMATLGDNGAVEISAGRSYYPLIYKTTDGGDTWSDQLAVAIAGSDGITGVQNFLSDSELAEIFTIVPPRYEIEFTTAFDFDMSVDAWGNPQIAVVIGITGTDPYSIITEVSEVTGYLFTASFLLSSIDGGTTWIGYNCGRLKTFRGTFGDVTEDNRIQITRSPDATKMFVTWLDTDLPGVTENNQPDLWCRGVDLTIQCMTHRDGVFEPDNVTEFSEGMWQAYMGIAANECFENGNTWTIPMTYQAMNPTDPTQPVLYKYIQDFKYTELDFWVGINDNIRKAGKSVVVSQNFPNPAHGNTTVTVKLLTDVNVAFDVVNVMGNKIYEVPAVNYSAGVHTFNFDVSACAEGVYFYTLTAGDDKITKKMIVK